jgi:3-methyl-2-oxobutanoate hydroxymethyltransferase
MTKRVTAPDIAAAKGQRRLTCITACDYPTGRLADESGVDMVLVGDSLAMVALGHEDTLSMTMDGMIHHAMAVSRGVSRALVIGDMPFLSYQPGVEQAVANAGRFLSEGRCQAVKAEGGRAVVPAVRAMIQAGIPVMGHVGLTPQHLATQGGYKVQGRTAEAALVLLEDAQALAQAGCFSIVLECVPAELGKRISAAVDVPTIGIGSGPHTDGQVLVMHDVLGLFDRFRPKFVKAYAKFWEQGLAAVKAYKDEVESGVFPGPEHSFTMPEEELARLDGKQTAD